jgi:predicted PurR-regulated permease PerM
VQQAANELEQAAQHAATEASAGAATGASDAAAARAPATKLTPITAPPPRAVTRVVVERPGFNIRDYLWSGTLGLVVLVGQVAIVLFVTLFLLASGDTFRRKMVKLAGPRLSQKKITVQALEEVRLQIQRYLLVQLATSVVVGVATGLAFYALGLHNAGVWGVAAGIANLVPYVGALVVGCASALVGFIQFDSIGPALLVGASSFAIHAVVGNLLTPGGPAGEPDEPVRRLHRRARLRLAVGRRRLILGTPILMVVKTVCDRIDELKPSASSSAPELR